MVAATRFNEAPVVSEALRRRLRKVFVSLLLLTHLGMAVQLQEFLKLPALLVHFTEHRKADAQLTFFQFLALHYDNSRHDQLVGTAHHNRHEHMPFKGSGTASAHLTFVVSPAPASYGLRRALDCVEKTYFGRLPDRVVPRFAADIWHPPQVG